MNEEASDEGSIGPARVDWQCQKASTLHCQSAHEGGDKDGWMRMWTRMMKDVDEDGSFSETVVWIYFHNYTYTKYDI